ncbi:hypothetical protein BSPWISOXPB_5751 [uncultured Gammaproteobacteria bacterium]|nr:hypothetical protein BSPWISOXPB_5751 [uncultured Gammaproteobacteria bacterium]
MGTVTGLGCCFSGSINSNPIGIAIVVIGASYGGSAFYDNTISDTVKSTLNNWFSDTPEQKQQKFSIIVNGAFF